MIQWVYESAIRSQSFKEVIVATDDDRIVDTVTDFGGKALMTSTSHLTGTDRLLEVVEFHPEYDAYFNLQGDEPLMDPQLLRDMVTNIEDLPEGGVLTPVHLAEVEDLLNPNVVKVIADLNGKACYFSRAAIPYQRGEPSVEATLYKHIGLYGFTISALKEIKKMTPHPVEQMERLEQLRWLLNGLPIYVHQTNYQAIGVDTLEQAQAVEQILRGE
jgi:3-deoxy-manno-octulosonate cytidylyltransferase (CMP-KDO synthetase)